MKQLTKTKEGGMKNLNELFEAMKGNDPRTLDKHGNWSADLPTFGGTAPDDTSEVWSWDKENCIIGTHNDDLEIVPRAEWNEFRKGMLG
jgi:hypothetical protein